MRIIAGYALSKQNLHHLECLDLVVLAIDAATMANLSLAKTC